MQDNCAVGRPSHRILPISGGSTPDFMALAPEGSDGPPSTCRELNYRNRSANLKVFGRLLATIAYNFVLDRLTLIKRAQACPLDSGNVDEPILSTALRLNESVP